MRANEFLLEYQEPKVQQAHRDGVDLTAHRYGNKLTIDADTHGRNLARVVFDVAGQILVAQDLLVDERYRGQGIASSMYDYAKELGYRVQRSADQTDAGKQFWDKNRGEEATVWEAEERTLDPNLYGEMLPTATVKRIVTGVMNQVDPAAKISVKQSPEGYYIVRSEGLRLDFGITADGGEIGANIVNAYSSYKGKNVVTDIFAQCFRAAEQLWGKPTKFVVSVQQDRGHGAWQAIAKKLGAEWGGSVMENFANGNSMSTKDMIAYLKQHHNTNLHQDYLDHINTFGKFVLKNISVNTIKTELSGLDRSKVEQYKKMDFSKAPPIVMGDGYILDGYHRATVAKALDIPTIRAYVGIKGQQDMAENFADGKVKGKSRPGRVKRAGASCNGSVTDLRARAKRASGEKAKMYHWCANMKSGKKK
jgi:GNAT superfamily N-acetyltransferase